MTTSIICAIPFDASMSALTISALLLSGVSGVSVIVSPSTATSRLTGVSSSNSVGPITPSASSRISVL